MSASQSGKAERSRPKLGGRREREEGQARARKSFKPEAGTTLRKSIETRERILDGAIRTIVSSGYHRTNMSRIAVEAGVTRGCLQYYFPTTEDALAAAAEHVSRTLWGAFSDEVFKVPEGRTRLDYALDSFFCLEDTLYFRAWLELQAAARTEPRINAIIGAWTDEAERLRERMSSQLFPEGVAHDADDFRAVADLLWLVLMADPQRALRWNAESRRANVFNMLKRFASAVWNKDGSLGVQSAAE